MSYPQGQYQPQGYYPSYTQQGQYQNNSGQYFQQNQSYLPSQQSYMQQPQQSQSYVPPQRSYMQQPQQNQSYVPPQQSYMQQPQQNQSYLPPQQSYMQQPQQNQSYLPPQQSYIQYQPSSNFPQNSYSQPPPQQSTFSQPPLQNQFSQPPMANYSTPSIPSSSYSGGQQSNFSSPGSYSPMQAQSSTGFGGNTGFGSNNNTGFGGNNNNTPFNSTQNSPFTSSGSGSSDDTSDEYKWTNLMFERPADFNVDYMVKAPWNSEMWKKWYDKLSGNKNRRYQIVGLLFKYTEQLIRDQHFVKQYTGNTVIRISAPSSHFNKPEAYSLGPPGRSVSRISSHSLANDPIKPTYAQTYVHVINADTLSIAAEMGERNAVVVNACSPDHLWYRAIETPELHQEEAIFTQTSLALVLKDVGYPFDDYTLIYTPSVAMNRDGVEKGFEFFKEPKRVNIISMPDDLLVPSGEKYELSLTHFRAKFEMVIRTAIKYGKTVLILPAFGYKKLKEANDTFAVIKTVLKEFAGCLTAVYFAISERYYSEATVCEYAENLLSIKNVKIGGVKKDYKHSSPVILRPRQSGNVTYVSTDKILCKYVGSCTDSKLSHVNGYWHPQMCPDPDCSDSSEVHLAMYMHRINCKYGDKCKLFIEHVALTMQNKTPNDDLRYHEFRFKHKKPCPSWNKCKDTTTDHYKEYSHPPSCPNGFECPQLTDPNHELCYRHDVRQCEKGVNCPFYADSAHTQQFAHPFLPFCPVAPYYCDDKTPGHCSSFSHICPGGPNCKDRGKPDHDHKFIHVGKVCPKGSACNDNSEEHLGTYYHDFSGCSTLCVRKKCSNPDCTNKDSKHLRDQRHYWENNMITMLLLNVQNPDPGNHDLMWAPVRENGHKWNNTMDRYLSGKIDTTSKNFTEIVGWFRSMRPNHMCSVSVFISIMNLGCYTSLELMRHFWTHPKDLLEAVMKCPYMEILKGKYSSVVDDNSILDIRKYTKKTIREKQGDLAKIHLSGASQDLIAKLGTTPTITDDKRKENIEFKTSLQSKYSGIEPFLNEIDELIVKILESVIALVKSPTGIGNTTNQRMKTNYTSWTIVGPHYDSYGGGEAVMVIKKEVMNHPDFYMCPLCTNYYYNASYANGRPWITGRDPQNGKTYADAFLDEKISRCSIGWEEAAAKEWIARASTTSGKAPANVTLSDVITYWKTSPTHTHCLEGHLPYRVPLDYTEHVILTQAAYNQIVGDKLGKAVLEYWKKKYGNGFITVTAGRTQDETSNYQNAHPIPKSECRTGMSFHIDDETEKPLPIDLPDGKFYITFAARGKFYATLATKLRFDEANRHVITISPSVDCLGLSAWYLIPMACIENKKVAKCDSFNVTCPYDDFVQYCIEVDYSSGTVTVTHWGPSSAFSNSVLKVKMEQTTDKYRYISFAGKPTKYENVAIWDLNISTEKPECSMTPEVFVPPPIQNVSSNANMLKPPRQNHPRNSSSTPPPPPQHSGTPPPHRNKSLPMCSDPFGCPKMANRKDPDHDSHIRQYKHVCKYGKSCRDINNRRHNEMFAHLDKPLCPDGPGCQNFGDPAHRLEYHHNGCIDYLLPCRYGTECRTQENPKHRGEYHHDPNFKFPDNFKTI